jgi:hypothetical protein
MPVIAALLVGFGLIGSGRAAEAAPRGYLDERPLAGPVDSTERSRGGVQHALRAGSYPWYDRDTDRLRPIWPPRRPWVKWLGDRIEKLFKSIDGWLRRFRFGRLPGLGAAGESLGTMLLMAVLVMFFAGLVVLWARHNRIAAAGSGAQSRLGKIARLADLPEGVHAEGEDPWELARRRRASGDYSGAIVSLFAHQLISLAQLGMIRLGPGRTGRQYVRGLRDPELLDPVRETLVLFEDVYYGRRVPAAEAFERVWRKAQAFEDRRSLLGASR